MSPVAVELPDQARVGKEGAGRGEGGGVVRTPEASSAAESWEAGRGGDSGTEDGEDATGLPQVDGEGLEVGGGDAGEGFG